MQNRDAKSNTTTRCLTKALSSKILVRIWNSQAKSMLQIKRISAVSPRLPLVLQWLKKMITCWTLSRAAIIHINVKSQVCKRSSTRCRPSKMPTYLKPNNLSALLLPKTLLITIMEARGSTAWVPRSKVGPTIATFQASTISLAVSKLQLTRSQSPQKVKRTRSASQTQLLLMMWKSCKIAWWGNLKSLWLTKSMRVKLTQANSWITTSSQ